jgi:fucose 4-O-acetylase-like acetyltransferase
MATHRLAFIDIARAISIIMIVVYHYNPENSPGWYSTLNNIGLSFRIPLLMFVSGYIYMLVKKPIKYKDFILNKFKRLIVPYLFVSIMVIFIKLLTEKNMYLENPISISSFYEMFYLPCAGYFVWFIYALFLIFLIMPFINTFRRLSAFLILSLVLQLAPVDFPEVFCLAHLKKYLFYFVFGCFICTKSNLKLIIDRIPAIVFLAFFAIVYGLTFAVHASFTPLINFSLAVSGIFFILGISMQIDKEGNPIKPLFVKLSSYTYTIYLFHTTAEGFAKAILMKIPLENYLTPDFCFIFKAFLIIIFGILAPVVIHKTVISKSRLFSFLTGAKYLPKKELNFVV